MSAIFARVVLERAGIAPDATSVSREQLEAARAIAVELATTAAYEAELSRVRQEASLSSRARLEAIMTHPEAVRREMFAQQLAFETELPADSAVIALRAAPKVVPLRRSRLEGNVPNPMIDPMVGPLDYPTTEAHVGAALNAAVDRQLGLRKPKETV
ncbi:hypothetical protein [Bradyrhizobium septentrionale]|uniref:Uncharacterized protein n=1 Tax=Bradyrhizobium septentrionale TaxID=1404411 RepID=A0ABZ2PBA3_9BRAD